MDLTPAEQVFVKRMLPHYLAGKSIEEAAAAVLADDERIFAALCDRGSSQYVQTVDERGRAIYSGDRPGDMIASELAATVYKRIRSE